MDMVEKNEDSVMGMTWSVLLSPPPSESITRDIE